VATRETFHTCETSLLRHLYGVRISDKRRDQYTRDTSELVTFKEWKLWKCKAKWISDLGKAPKRLANWLRKSGTWRGRDM